RAGAASGRQHAITGEVSISVDISETSIFVNVCGRIFPPKIRSVSSPDFRRPRRVMLAAPTKEGGLKHIAVTVNGALREAEVEPRQLLVYFLREQLGLTGTNVGCDTSSCGACTVLLGGESVKSCTVLAVQADGAEVTTIEGLATNGELH